MVFEIEFSEVKHKVVSQDYIILGKQAKEIEIKIHCDFGNALETKRRIDTAIRGAAYADYRYKGGDQTKDDAWKVKDENSG